MISIFSNIPSSWTVRNIPDIFFFQEGPGVRKWQFREKGIKLLNGSNINNGVLDLSNTKIHLDETEANGKYKHFLVNEGDLVIASSGVVVDNFHNKIAFVKKENLPLCMNTSTIRFQVLDDKLASLEFLKFFLKTIYFKRQIGKLITGSAQLNFGPSHLQKIQIPLPPLEDQIRIAAVLTRAEKLIAKRKESIKALEEFLKSTFLEMFGLNSPDYKQWKVEPLCTHTEIVSGVTKGKKYKSSNLKEVPYMRVTNVQDGHLNLTEIKTIAVPDDEIQQYKLRKGDLLLTEGGDPDKLGRGAVWNDEIDECIHQNHIFRVRVRVKDKSINPVFLSALMASKYGKSYFLKAAKQTTGIASINSTQLKAFPLIKPPLPLQTQFASVVEKVESLKSRYAQSLAELENLYGSLSQRAFKGELDLGGVSVD